MPINQPECSSLPQLSAAHGRRHGATFLSLCVLFIWGVGAVRLFTVHVRLVFCFWTPGREGIRFRRKCG